MTAAEIIPAHLPLELYRDGQRSRVEELIDLWLVGYRSANTREAYAYDLRVWLGYCAASGIDPLGGVRRPHVDAWLRGLEFTREAPATRRRRLNAVSAFYRWCVDEEHLLRNPARAVTRPPVDRDLTRTGGLSEPQLEALLHAADTSTHPHAPRESLAFRLMAGNGLRVSSVCALNVGDLGTVRGARGITYWAKGDRTLFAPFNRPTAEACDRYLDYLAGRAGAGVLDLHRGGPGGAGRPMFTLYGSEVARATKASFTAALRRLARESLPRQVAERITPHWLRHAFTTLSLAKGAELRDVQWALGHADPKTTQVYDDDMGNIDRHPTHRLAAAMA